MPDPTALPPLVPPPLVVPPLVVQLGVYRSASTWAANVVAALLRPHGAVRILFDDATGPAPLDAGPDERLVVKVHSPSAPLLRRARHGTPPFVITIREPLDCVASMMRQFDVAFEAARAAVAQSCRSVSDALAFGQATRFVVLRYEAGARDAAAVRAVADLLGVTDADADAVAAALAPGRVNAFIDGLIAGGRFGERPTPAQSDPATHWHPRHLGSGAAGIFRETLSGDQIAAVEASTAGFRRMFGYRAPPTGRVGS